MSRKKYSILFLVTFQTIYAKSPELPLCPTNIAFFPQSLPMHCRMANGKTFNSEPIPMKSQASATFPPSIYQSPSPNKVPPPMPFPVPPGFPAPIFPPGMAIPPMAAIPASVPIPIPGPPPQKLPVIVMPFYSPDPVHKKDNNDRRKKPKKKDSSESGSCSDYDYSDSSGGDGPNSSGFWRPGKIGKKRRGHKRILRRSGGGISRHSRKHKDLLTPMIQYVTKDGYVIFEKEISKGEAKDWLSKKGERENEKGVSFKELDEIKHELGEDNVVEDHDQPKLTSVVGDSANERMQRNPNIRPPTQLVPRQTFKKVEVGGATHNRIIKFKNKGITKNE